TSWSTRKAAASEPNIAKYTIHNAKGKMKEAAVRHFAFCIVYCVFCNGGSRHEGIRQGAVRLPVQAAAGVQLRRSEDEARQRHSRRPRHPAALPGADPVAA